LEGGKTKKSKYGKETRAELSDGRASGDVCKEKRVGARIGKGETSYPINRAKGTFTKRKSAKSGERRSGSFRKKGTSKQELTKRVNRSHEL